MKTPRILLVDDEEATLFGYTRYLTKGGYSIETAKCLREAKKLIASEQFDAILLDLKLPDGNAIDWISELHSSHEHLAIIVITGVSDIPTAVRAMKYGAYNFLTKPVNMDDLAISLKKGLEVEELRRRDSIYQRLAPHKSEPFFGESSIIEKVVQYANVAAMNNTVVLLHGETGTGKEYWPAGFTITAAGEMRLLWKSTAPVSRGASEKRTFGHAKALSPPLSEIEQG